MCVSTPLNKCIPWVTAHMGKPIINMHDNKIQIPGQARALESVLLLVQFVLIDFNIHMSDDCLQHHLNFFSSAVELSKACLEFSNCLLGLVLTGFNLFEWRL